MNKNQNRSPERRKRLLFGATGLLLAAALAPTPQLLAAEYSISGASETILRLGKSVDSRNLYPLTEYLRLSVVSPLKEGTVALHLGGWGRVDLADRSRDGYSNGDLQFGYLGFRGNRNNLVINAGRQFVTEGVAAQRLDGLYIAGDLAGGFAAAAFAGAPLVTEPNLDADDFVFGGRVSRSNHRSYVVGVSALKSLSGGDGYREEEGLDLWLKPLEKVEVTGRSSYNSVTRGWMEHAYIASFTPAEKLRLYAELSGINYRDYFHRVTTSAFLFDPQVNGIDPDESLVSAGAGGSYAVSGNLSVAGEYKHYDYEVAGPADYYGATLSYASPGLGGGLSLHRMDGDSSRLRYTGCRLYALKKVGEADLTLDLIDVIYDYAMNGVKHSVTAVAGGSYHLRDDLKMGASLEFSRNPFFDREFQGLVKLTYLFDPDRSAEGVTESEK